MGNRAFLFSVALVACGGDDGGSSSPDAGVSSALCDEPFGAVTELAPAVDPYGVAVDATTVYWAEQGRGVTGAGGLDAVRLSDGGRTTLTTGNIYELSVDDTDVYYQASTGLYRIAKAGGTPVEIAPLATDGLALDAADVYYGYDYLMRVPKAGGATMMLDTARPRRIALDDRDIYYTTSTNTLVRLPKSGGMPTTLASDVSRAVAVDREHVYYSRSDLSRSGLFRIPKQGGTEQRLSAASDAFEVTAIVVDETCVYWVNRNDGGVIRTSKSGSEELPPSTMGRGLVFGLAIDADAVYWGTVPYAGEEPGEIYRAAKL